MIVIKMLMGSPCLKASTKEDAKTLTPRNDVHVIIITSNAKGIGPGDIAKL